MSVYGTKRGGGKVRRNRQARPAPEVEAYEPLREGALVEVSDETEISADIVIIGSGMGGSAAAYALSESGLDVLVVERGDFLPRELENADPFYMHVEGRYKNAEQWYDGRTGKPFSPGTYYFVGGNTKFYGASLPRFREQDFEATIHHDGTSQRWPFSYDDIEPFYSQAEEVFQVHGTTSEDPTEPFHSAPYPHPPLEHEPVIERLAEDLKQQGLHPFHSPNGMNAETPELRASNSASDGSPSLNDVKSEAENRLLRPALRSGSVRLLVNAKVEKLLTDDDGGAIAAAEVTVQGRPITITAKQFVVSAGAVNTATLLMRSKTARHPDGLANSSGLLGRNYMVHNSTFFVAFNPLRTNDTQWQKTMAINDWYLSGDSNEYPLGNVQMLGKLRGAMVKNQKPLLPMAVLDLAMEHSMDLYLTTEDLPRLDNRVEVDGDKTLIYWRPNNLEPHKELVKRVTKAIRKAGYPFVFTQKMGIETNSHMCGTAVAGADPETSVLNPDCRAHDIENLWVIDGSFFPSSAALNPALTIAANAFRVAPKVAAAAR